jgi:signal transduction histidine kinase
VPGCRFLATAAHQLRTPVAALSAFERFVTLDGQGGTGLGLAIARELAQRQGGDVLYERKAFILRLPMAGQARRAAGRVDQPSGGGRRT